MRKVRTFEEFVNESLNESQAVTLQLKADDEWPQVGDGLTFIKIMYSEEDFVGIYFDSSKKGIVNSFEGSRGTETRKIMPAANDVDANKALQIAFDELKDKKFKDTKQAEAEIKKIVKKSL